jgi:GxxExxY protein
LNPLTPRVFTENSRTEKFDLPGNSQCRLFYKRATLDPEYRVDLVVEGTVIVELKCIERVLSVHDAQVLTYLRLTGCPVGLLINFNVPRFKDGVRRLLNPRRTICPGAEIDIPS